MHRIRSYEALRRAIRLLLLAHPLMPDNSVLPCAWLSSVPDPEISAELQEKDLFIPARLSRVRLILEDDVEIPYDAVLGIECSAPSGKT